MEGIQILKYCPWIADEVNVKEYFDEYNIVLDETNGNKPHNEKLEKETALREFFHIPEDIDFPLSQRSTPALSLHARSVSIDSNSETMTFNKGSLDKGKPSLKWFGEKLSRNKLPMRSMSANDIESQKDSVEENEDLEDPFCIKKLEEDCDPGLLTVEGELPPRDVCESGYIGDSGRVTNWYAGAFMDGVIPDGGTEKLVTLAMQAKELYKRETVRDYTRLRHRLLKYASTVRMVMKKENHPENISLDEDTPKSSLRDIILNIRIQRPYHKKSYQKKGPNRYPKHSQEMYMLGSQKLTELRDAIICINDVYVHEDMSNDPNKNKVTSFPCSKELFPSSFFYVNGVFYSDMRNPNSKDCSEILRKWAMKYPLIGEMPVKKMEETNLVDLKLRPGYPYVYQHLGNCEHLITITDVRLHHCSDVQDPSRYPLSRGNPIVLSITCFACNLHLANWILKGHPKIPAPYTHFCDQCLKTFCYDENGKKLEDFKVYPFTDEFAAMEEKFQREKLGKKVQINMKNQRMENSSIVIEPFED